MSKKEPKDACCPDLGELMEPEFFKALCDPNRIALLTGLSQQKEGQTVQAMAGCCNVDLSVVSRHLAKLKAAGILAAKKQGKEVRYTVNASKVAQTLRSIADCLESCLEDSKEIGGSNDE